MFNTLQLNYSVNYQDLSHTRLQGSLKINYIMALPGLKIRNCKFWLNYLEEVGEIVCLISL